MRSLIDLHIKPRRTVRLSGKLTGVNRPPARCENVIFVTSTFHVSMESSFETQFKVDLLKTDPEHHFPDPHSFKLSNRIERDNLKRFSELFARARVGHTHISYDTVRIYAGTRVSISKSTCMVFSGIRVFHEWHTLRDAMKN